MSRRILIYDDGAGLLSWAWWFGSGFIGSFDVVLPVRSWTQAYRELAALPRVPAAALQLWCHGNQGDVFLGDEDVNVEALGLALGPLAPNAYVWFRACAAFGGVKGHRFAADAVDALRCGVVGHTRIVGAPCQSGGHGLLPGQAPYWPVTEGVGPDGKLLRSGPLVPNTCVVTRSNPPAAWWVR